MDHGDGDCRCCMAGSVVQQNEQSSYRMYKISANSTAGELLLVNSVSDQILGLTPQMGETLENCTRRCDNNTCAGFTFTFTDQTNSTGQCEILNKGQGSDYFTG